MGTPRTPVYRSLAQLLRAACGSRSKCRVARATGVSHSNLFGMEAGTRFPSERTLKVLYEYYGLDFEAALLAGAQDKLRCARRMHICCGCEASPIMR